MANKRPCLFIGRTSWAERIRVSDISERYKPNLIIAEGEEEYKEGCNIIHRLIASPRPEAKTALFVVVFVLFMYG